MKHFLLCFIALFSSATIFAQNFTEGFETTPEKDVPADWIVSSSTDVKVYSRPKVCGTSEKGLLTPGVGQSAPLRMILPLQTYNGISPNFAFSFFISVLDPDLNCSSYKPFECRTYVKAYLVAESWFTSNSRSYVLNSNFLPPTNLIYAQIPNYEILTANSNNTITFNLSPSLAANTKFRILLEFKTASNSNCSASGTKFIFDDLKFEQTCTNCAPTANNDYFNASTQGFTNTIKGNLFGGNTQWLNEIASAGYSDYLINSLSNGTAINNGVDFDPLSTSLSSITYSLVPGSITTNGDCSTGSISLVVNPNGTFTLSKGTDVCIKQVSFTYQLTNTVTNLVATANVTVVFPISTLPVSFKSFTATRNKEIVALKWETASEVNNRGFYVQRNTADGTWKDIAFVFSQADGGNSSSILTYHLNDPNNVTGVSHYRIMQVDLDGKGRYSEIRTVRAEQQAAKVMLYPNPSNDGNINVVFEEKISVKDVVISDATGRMIKQWRGLASNNLLIENLQSGLYTIHVTNRTNATTMVEKFIVQKR